MLYFCVFTHETFYFQKEQRKVFFSAKGFGAGRTVNNGVVIFNQNFIEANEGEGFDKTTGRFRAPLAGAYEFGFSGSTSYLYSPTQVRVFKNDSPQYYFFNSNEGRIWNDFSTSWIYKLSAGEEVYLKVATGNLHFVQFSGKLLKADD